MTKPSWEDLDVFVQTDDNGGFATLAVIHFQNGTTRPNISVIFDDPYLNAELGEYDMDTSRPRVSGKMSDLAGVDRGDTIEIDGEIYDILTRPQDDGSGWGMLDVSEQNA